MRARSRCSKAADDIRRRPPRAHGAPERAGQPAKRRVRADVRENGPLADLAAEAGDPAVLEDGRREADRADTRLLRDETQGNPAAVARADRGETADVEGVHRDGQHRAGLLCGRLDVRQGPRGDETRAVADTRIVEPDRRESVARRRVREVCAESRPDQVVPPGSGKRDHDSRGIALRDSHDRRDVAARPRRRRRETASRGRLPESSGECAERPGDRHGGDRSSSSSRVSMPNRGRRSGRSTRRTGREAVLESSRVTSPPSARGASGASRDRARTVPDGEIPTRASFLNVRTSSTRSIAEIRSYSAWESREAADRRLARSPRAPRAGAGRRPARSSSDGAAPRLPVEPRRSSSATAWRLIVSRMYRFPRLAGSTSARPAALDLLGRERGDGSTEEHADQTDGPHAGLLEAGPR